MIDFLIKLLGGYRAVVVVVEKTHFGTKSVSTMTTFYPFVKMILKTELGIVEFNKDMSVKFSINQNNKL